MMKNMVWVGLAVILMFGLSGCLGTTGNTENTDGSKSISEGAEQPATDNAKNPENDDSIDPNEPVSSDGSDSADETEEIPAKNRPKTKTDTIGLEGNEETFQFTLHDVPGLQFSTYIVNDFLVEGAGSGEGDTLIVYANFAGQTNEDAKAVYFSPSAGTQTTVEEQAEAAKRSLESEGYEVRQSDGEAPMRFAVSEKEIHFTKQKEDGHYLLGTVSVFTRGDRVYRILVQYPEDWEEGFVPRVVKMMEDIMWYDI
ncbi:hypothetical protein [Paenibacillus thermotolerans]|uniref:hypothetical protein n=1 Tax=Paenibacillus thermotolerans TaxID=3027807 RepID=UPI0023683F6D|nr:MULTISPECIES: hypothetical protein [unclassified Paenibacillus]